MIEQRKKKKSLYVTPLGILMAFVTLYSVVPFVPQLVSDYLSTYLYMTLLLTIVVGLVLSESFHTLIRYIVLVLPLVLFCFLNLVANDWAEDVVIWGYKTLLECLPLLFGFYLCYVKKKLLRFESGVLLFSVAVTILTTIVGLIRYPSAARVLATDLVEDTPLLRIYNLNNIGGYDFIYLLVLLYPILIYAYKHKKIKLFPAILISLAMFFCILQSEYTLALLLFAITTVLFFVKRKFRVKNLLVLLLVSTVLILIFWSQVSKLLVWVSQYIESEDVRVRILALAGGRAGLDAIDDKRLTLYLRSIQTFWQLPILGRLTPGAPYAMAGNHSFLLDALAEFGIVGGALLFILYRKIYNLFYKPLKKDDDYGFIFWCFLLPILLSLLNTGMWGYYLMFGAPILIRLVRGEDAEKVPTPYANATPQQAPDAQPEKSS